MGVEYIKVQQHESSVYRDLPAPVHLSSSVVSSFRLARTQMGCRPFVVMAIFSLSSFFSLLWSHTTSPMILAASL